MRYHLYIEDSTVDDLIELEGPDSQTVLDAGYLEEKTIEADDIEEALKIAREWAVSQRAAVFTEIETLVCVGLTWQPCPERSDPYGKSPPHFGDDGSASLATTQVRNFALLPEWIPHGLVPFRQLWAHS